jgi:hypothetical protein
MTGKEDERKVELTKANVFSESSISVRSVSGNHDVLMDINLIDVFESIGNITDIKNMIINVTIKDIDGMATRFLAIDRELGVYGVYEQIADTVNDCITRLLGLSEDNGFDKSFIMTNLLKVKKDVMESLDKMIISRNKIIYSKLGTLEEGKKCLNSDLT